uniref:Swt1-like HEPN domain-containing protein n=1 Tax=Globisporangium ultimum (strain ATCC 200006 / CBS 805.95 / DAOM BR144) TaxID=431595 RepID=K3WSB1_GLOUD
MDTNPSSQPAMCQLPFYRTPSESSESEKDMRVSRGAPSPPAAAVAACLQSIITVLHPEFQRFVQQCVRAHILEEAQVTMKELPKYSVDAHVTAILNASMQRQHDFAAYLSFVLTHWDEYFEYSCGSYYELRAIVQSVLRLRNNVAHQIEVTGTELGTAMDILTRFAVFIRASRATRDHIRACVNAMEASTPTAVMQIKPQSQQQQAGSDTYLLSPQLERTLCPKLMKFVRYAVANSVFRAQPVELTRSTCVALEDQVSSILRSEILSPSSALAAPFGAYLRFIYVNWHADFKFAKAYPELRDVVKQARRYYEDFIVPQVAMSAQEFNDAVDAFSQLAAFIRASQSTAFKLRDLLQDTEVSQTIQPSTVETAPTSLAIQSKLTGVQPLATMAAHAFSERIDVVVMLALLVFVARIVV